MSVSIADELRSICPWKAKGISHDAESAAGRHCIQCSAASAWEARTEALHAMLADVLNLASGSVTTRPSVRAAQAELAKDGAA